MTARSDQTPAVIFSCKSWHRKRKLNTVRTAPFLIFIIDVSTRIVKRAPLFYAASRKFLLPTTKPPVSFQIQTAHPTLSVAFCCIPTLLCFISYIAFQRHFMVIPMHFPCFLVLQKCTFPHFWSFQHFPDSLKPVQYILLFSFIIARCPSFVNSPSAP